MTLEPPGQCPATTLSVGATVGLALTAAASVLSAGAVVVVALLVLYHVHQRRGDTSASYRPAIKSHVDVYMVSLLVSDLLQAVGGIINIHHARLQRTECGPYCTAQGVLKSLGEPSAAMATLAITVHTFASIFFHWNPPAGWAIPGTVVSFIWLYCGLYVGTAWALHHSPGREFFQPVPLWCWVSSLYPAQRISAEYFWLWFSAFASVLFYIPLFLFIRGNIAVDPIRPWRMSLRRSTPRQQNISFNRVRQSLKMLLYPIVYLIIVLPLSVVRWIAFVHGDGAVPVAGTFIGIIPFHLAGLLNVLLLILTRPSILVFGGSYETNTTETAPSRTPRIDLTQGLGVSVHIQTDVYGYDADDENGIPKITRIELGTGLADAKNDAGDVALDVKPGGEYHLERFTRPTPNQLR